MQTLPKNPQVFTCGYWTEHNLLTQWSHIQLRSHYNNVTFTSRAALSQRKHWDLVTVHKPPGQIETGVRRGRGGRVVGLAPLITKTDICVSLLGLRPCAPTHPGERTSQTGHITLSTLRGYCDFSMFFDNITSSKRVAASSIWINDTTGCATAHLPQFQQWILIKHELVVMST